MITNILLRIEIGVDPTIVEVASKSLGTVYSQRWVSSPVWRSQPVRAKDGLSRGHDLQRCPSACYRRHYRCARLYVIEELGQFENDLADIFRSAPAVFRSTARSSAARSAAQGYAMITKVPNIPRGANIAAIGATVGMAVGRIGDIINGEHCEEHGPAVGHRVHRSEQPQLHPLWCCSWAPAPRGCLRR